MTQEEIGERIVAIVNEMRENTNERYMWKNIPLAKEGLELIKQIDSETQKTNLWLPKGKREESGTNLKK